MRDDNEKHYQALEKGIASVNAWLPTLTEQVEQINAAGGDTRNYILGIHYGLLIWLYQNSDKLEVDLMIKDQQWLMEKFHAGSAAPAEQAAQPSRH